MAPVPTCVIGVGQAGVKVLSTLADRLADTDHREQFNLVAVDTDPDQLDDAPEEASRFYLDADLNLIDEDTATYPYLTREMEVEHPGTKRHRPVGRYKLDNRGQFDAVFDGLWRSIEDHVEERRLSLAESSHDWLQVYLVGSFAGGTGSGTFPLFGAMLDEIADSVERSTGVDCAVAGVGMVPSSPRSRVATLPGQPVYYPNTYAALEDLDTLLSEPAADDPLELPVYSQTLRNSGDAKSAFSMDSPPFDGYWLVGQNERRMAGDNTDVPETYRELVNETVAAAVHAGSLLSAPENYWGEKPPVGTIDRSTVRVPHDRVRELCRLERDRADTRAELEDMRSRIDEIRTRCRRLNDVRDDPSEAPEQLSMPELEDEVRSAIENEFGTPGAVLDRGTPDGVSAFVEDVTDRYDSPAAELYAVTVLDRVVSESGAFDRVETEYSDTVSRLWDRYDASGHPGAADVRTLRGRRELLDEFLSETLAEHEDMAEQTDESVLDLVPPSVDFLQSRRQELEARIERVREDLDTLQAAHERYERAVAVRDRIREGSERRRLRLSDQIRDLEDERFDLEEECRGHEHDLERFERDIEALREELTEPRTEQQLAVVPLEADAVDSLDAELAGSVDEELPSVRAYLEKGFVDESVLKRALNQAQEYSEAWENPLFERDVTATDDQPAHPDHSGLWIRVVEADEPLLDLIDTATAADETRVVRTESSDDSLAAHRVEFVSVAHRGPLTATRLYSDLDEMAADGVMTALAGPYEDYRQAFAYPEWYGNEVREAFDIVSRVELPRPPELDPSRVSSPDDGADEYVETKGVDEYLWRGTAWTRYDPPVEEEAAGWQTPLSRNGVSFADFQRASPPSELKGGWLAGRTDWADVVDAYREGVAEETDLTVEFR